MTDSNLDPRVEIWREGSYEIAGDWIRPASISILDRLVEVSGAPIEGRSLLDIATGTGAVAIEAALRGATVVGIDLTPDLVDIARSRAEDASTEVRFEVGDFDHLDDAIGQRVFDLATSTFGVMFSPEPQKTLLHIGKHLRSGGLFGVTAWDPDNVFMVPDSIWDLLPERPPLPAWWRWATEIDSLCDGTSMSAVVKRADEVLIPFDSITDCADQLVRWSGGWGRLFSALSDGGVADLARERLIDHLSAFATSTDDGILLSAAFHASVLSRR